MPATRCAILGGDVCVPLCDAHLRDCGRAWDPLLSATAPCAAIIIELCAGEASGVCVYPNCSCERIGECP